ncbi:hypothetical protein [Streptomyces sp. NBC_00063]|uniref:hypothetical protein n=1 Tax=Streptomyces sp. NBC_00063 TaxID=2975638 RepID=UPI003D756FEA
MGNWRGGCSCVVLPGHPGFAAGIAGIAGIGLRVRMARDLRQVLDVIADLLGC